MSGSCLVMAEVIDKDNMLKSCRRIADNASTKTYLPLLSSEAGTINSIYGWLGKKKGKKWPHLKKLISGDDFVLTRKFEEGI